MFNLTKIGNQISDCAISSILVGAVGYGLTRTFTVLNPIAGATFCGSFVLAGVLTNPIFNSTSKGENSLANKGGYNPNVKSSKGAKILGRVIQIALTWFANPYLTPIVSSSLSVGSAKIMAAKSLIAGSVNLPLVGVTAAVALLILIGLFTYNTVYGSHDEVPSYI